MKTVLLAAVFFIFPATARSIDIATEHTQIFNNIELIAENLRLLQSLENQIEMIKNQVEGLKSVANYKNGFEGIEALRRNLTAITSQGAVLSMQTRTIMDQIQREINSFPPGASMIEQQEDLNQNTLNVVRNALARAGQLRQGYQQQVDSVNDLMAKNDQAVGQTQALQTSNELAAQTIAQNQSTQELLSEQISLQAAMMSKQLRQEKDEDDKMKQIFNASDDGSSIFGGA